VDNSARNDLRADLSVDVLDFDDDSSRPVSPRRADQRRKFNIRPGPLLGIVIAHGAVVALVVAMPGERYQAVETEPLVTVFLRPKIIVSRDPSVTPRTIRLPKAAPLVYEVTVPDVEQPTVSIIGVGTMAPYPEDEAIDARSFAQRAGLRPDEGATVVLRVKILGTGDVDDVQIDVSGGSARVDDAAVAYARTIRWVGGVIDGRPAAMWIRWGVRLQG
jgi:TonB family protein